MDTNNKDHLTREVMRLYRLGKQAYDEQEYALGATLLERAASDAQQLDNLFLLSRPRFWLADSLRKQGKYQEALLLYIWLISQASDPAASQKLADDSSLWLLANAFIGFISCGQKLPDISTEQLLQVIDDAIQWLERVGKPEWIAGLREERSELLWQQGDREGGYQEAEAALALARRYPDAPGYELPTYLFNLADLLKDDAIKEYDRAAQLMEEVLKQAGGSLKAQSRAYTSLASINLRRQNYEAAYEAARQSIVVADLLNLKVGMAYSYGLLSSICEAMGRVDEAVEAGVQMWLWTRRLRNEDAIHTHASLLDCARARIMQAREACGLPLTGEIVAKKISSSANTTLALRRLKGAERFLCWAREDLEQSTCYSCGTDLKELREKKGKLLALMARRVQSEGA